jgi:hypothetical protein
MIQHGAADQDDIRYVYYNMVLSTCCAYSQSMAIALNRLYDGADALSSATADGFKPVLRSPTPHLMEQRDQTHGSGGGNGMAKGYP